jgi:hypothetical protein
MDAGPAAARRRGSAGAGCCGAVAPAGRDRIACSPGGGDAGLGRVYVQRRGGGARRGPEVSWVDEHLLVIAGGRRRNQAEPGGPASLANRAIKDQAPQISVRGAGEVRGGVQPAARR